MTAVNLTSRAIGAIRKLVDRYSSRDELKQFLLDAGANANRVLAIQVTGDMRSPHYKSKSTIMNEGFDTIYQDFDKVEADGILLELVRVVFSRQKVQNDDRALLDRALQESGIALGEILEPGGVRDYLQSAGTAMESANLREAGELLGKALLRMSTDPPGAITAAVSAAESVCREALSRLGIPEPNTRQLPNYLVELRRQTNLEGLATVANVGDRAIRAFSSLAENAYQAAHETGDRHAHGDRAKAATPLVADMLITSACSIAIVLAGALRRNEIVLRNSAEGQI
jgi:hypothetical protein